MNIRSEKGFTGADITVAIIILITFSALIATLFYNYSVLSQELERQSKATQLAVDGIEFMKYVGFDSIKEINSTNTDEIKNYEDAIKEEIQDENGYDINLNIKDYAEVAAEEGLDTKISGLIKQITVAVKYRVNNQDRDVTIKTIISAEE